MYTLNILLHFINHFLLLQVYQLGRALTAVTLQQDTVDVARRHALQLISVEQRLGMFIEPAVQRYFLQFPNLMKWINWLYSFIHIPGSIFFLAMCLSLALAGPPCWAVRVSCSRRAMASPISRSFSLNSSEVESTLLCMTEMALAWYGAV